MAVTLNHPPAAPISDELLRRWRKIPVAVAIDMAPQCQISPEIRPLCSPGKQPPLFGRAVTASATPPDFGAVIHALDVVKRGDVLVIAANGQTRNAMIGDVLGGHLANKGAAGIVCDGAIRDVRHLAQMEIFSVYARAVNPRGPTSAAQGQVNAAVMVGGRLVNPGDLVIGDDDGLAALTPGELETYIGAAEAKLEKEAGWIKNLASGLSALTIFGLN